MRRRYEWPKRQVALKGATHLIAGLREINTGFRDEGNMGKAILLDSKKGVTSQFDQFASVPMDLLRTMDQK